MTSLEKIEFKLTSACNARCCYCINDDGSKTALLGEETIIPIIQAVKPRLVSFTGGEPLLCKKTLIACIEAAKKVNCQVQINTNLELATPTILQDLVQAGLDVLHVTFDTLKPDVYAQIRGTNAAKLAEVIGNLFTAVSLPGLKVIPEIVPLSSNVRELPELYEFVCLLGATGLEIQALISGGRTTSDLFPLRSVLAEKILEVVQMIGENKPYLELWCFSPLEYPELFGLEMQGVRYAPCICGHQAAYVDCDGSILACNFFLGQKAGNIFDPSEREPCQNFLDIWQNSPVFQQIRQGCFGEKLCHWQKSKEA